MPESIISSFALPLPLALLIPSSGTKLLDGSPADMVVDWIGLDGLDVCYTTPIDSSRAEQDQSTSSDQQASARALLARIVKYC